MAISLFDVSIPTIVRTLTTLQSLLDKGAASAEARKFDPKALLDARLAPNMYALTKQVQVVCDIAKGSAARLAQVEVPKHEDNETNVQELKARVAKTLEFVRTIRRDQVDGGEARQITMKFPQGEMKFSGLAYLNDFALPNLYFHLSMVYALLRHNGVELTKGDFLGAG
jgi:uncharacterized protein